MNNDHIAHKIAHRAFWSDINCRPELRAQVENIMADNSCDCEPDFLGFLGQYYHLSKIIPYDRVIYDLGCCYGIQSWFFRKHEKYIGVDIHEGLQFQLPNTVYHQSQIKDFLIKHVIKKPHFAICNYVPPWGDNNKELTKKYFEDVFVFYPQGINPLRLFKKATKHQKSS